MSPEVPVPCPARQRGLSLPAMLVIIVILGVVSAALVRLTATAQVAVGYEILSLRAWEAAEAGAQNAMARLFPLDNSAANCTALTLNFGAGNLNGCSVSVNCSGPVSFGGHDMYTLTSTATCSAGEALASRTLKLGARTP